MFSFLIPELLVLLITFFYGEKSWSLGSPVLLILYTIPLGGTFLTFSFKSMIERKVSEFRDYLIITGLSMLSIFYNSTALLMWKLKVGFFWLIPVLTFEPIAALFYLKSLEEREN